MSLKEKVNIIDGPGKWDFVNSVFAETEDLNRDKYYTVEPNVSDLIIEKSDQERVRLRIESVKVLDSKSRDFFITGVFMRLKDVPNRMMKFKGRYDLRTRQGHLHLESLY